MKMRKVGQFVLRTFLIVAVTIFFVYPFWWMVVNSLNTSAQVFGKPTLLPVSWRWENYKEIFQIQPFGRHLFNSILVALIGTAGNVLISAFSGYAFARIRFPGREVLFILLLTALMMPIEVIIIPLFFQMRDWGFNDSLKPLMLIPIFGAQGAFSAFMFRQFFITIPKELEEAAIIDGASQWRIMWQIYVPTSTAALATVALLSTVYHWNEWFNGILYMKTPDQYPLQSYLRTIVIDMKLTNMGANDWQALALVSDKTVKCAQIFLASLPILVAYPFLQRYFVKGMVLGSVKG